MTSREQLISLVDNDIVRPSDAIILLEGDGLNRYKQAVRLYYDHMASHIVFSGGITERERGGFPHTDIVPLMLADGIPEGVIIIEGKSRHTREQALEAVHLASSRSWRRLILVASHYHQYRAYLAFLKVIIDEHCDMLVYNAPVRDLPWFKNDGWGERFDLLAGEFKKIEEYSLLGHMASIDEAIDHQHRKESEG